jgi:hypothetical protein
MLQPNGGSGKLAPGQEGAEEGAEGAEELADDGMGPPAAPEGVSAAL